LLKTVKNSQTALLSRAKAEKQTQG